MNLKNISVLIIGGSSAYMAAEIFHSILGGALVGAAMALLLHTANKLLEKK